jgi:predicted ABC-type ATPase
VNGADQIRELWATTNARARAGTLTRADWIRHLAIESYIEGASVEPALRLGARLGFLRSLEGAVEALDQASRIDLSGRSVDVLLLEFREEDHPRGGEGTAEGGRFVSAGGGTPKEGDDEGKKGEAKAGAAKPKATKAKAPKGDGGGSEPSGSTKTSEAEKDEKKSTHEERVKGIKGSDKNPLDPKWDVNGERETELSSIRRSVPFREVKGTAKEAAADLSKNATLAVSQYARKLSGDDALIANGWAQDTVGALVEAFPDADAGKIDAIMRDAVDRLVYQHRESTRRALTDHGIRHIVGDVENATQIMDAMQGGGLGITAKDRAIVSLALVNHDYGYASPDMRDTFKNAPHVTYSAQLYDRDLRDTYAEVMGEQNADWITYAIATHSDAALDWEKEPLASAVRMADNFSLFEAQKLPALFREIDGAKKDLESMWFAGRDKDAKAFDAAKERLLGRVKGADLDDESKTQLGVALKDVSIMSAKFMMWRLAGDLSGFEYGDLGEGARGVTAHLTYKDDSHLMRDMFGVTAPEFLAFAKDLGADEKDLSDDKKIRDGIELRSGGKLAARIVVDNVDDLLEGAKKLLAMLGLDPLLLYSDDQARDELGRWTSDGGAASAGVGEDLIKAAKSGVIRNIKENSDGFSWNPRKGAAKSGVMVGYHPNEARGFIVRNGESTANLERRAADFVDKNLAFVEEDPDHRYFGGWAERDKTTGEVVGLHIEVSERFDAGEETKAVQEGKDRNQKAVFRIDDYTEIDTGGTGERTESAKASREHAPRDGRAEGTPNRVDMNGNGPTRAPDVARWHNDRPDWVKVGADGLADSRVAAYVGGKVTGERQVLHNQIVKEMLGDGPRFVENPKLIVTMGGAASGKSSMLKSIPHEGFAHLDADEAKRRIPEYREAQFDGWAGAAAFVHEESSEINKSAIKAARELRMNVIVDTVGQDPGKVAALIRSFRDQGYTDEVHYLDFDYEKARPFHDQRAEKTGRIIPEGVMRGQYEALPKSFSQVAKVASKAVMYNRRAPGSPPVATYVEGGGAGVADAAFLESFQRRAGQ